MINANKVASEVVQKWVTKENQKNRVGQVEPNLKSRINSNVRKLRSHRTNVRNDDSSVGSANNTIKTAPLETINFQKRQKRQNLNSKITQSLEKICPAIKKYMQFLICTYMIFGRYSYMRRLCFFAYMQETYFTINAAYMLSVRISYMYI